MKKFLLASAAVIALASSASAADLAARTYTKAPVAPISPLTNWSGFYVGAFGGYGWSGSSSNNLDLKGGFGGGTIGYNWQGAGSPVVWGIEVDAAGASIRQSAGLVGVLTAEDKIRAFGTVTGRVGYAFDSALLYVKGGYAWADNRFSVNVAGVNFSDSKLHSGWTVGAGLEYMFLPSWSAKAEYQYADFGNQTYFANLGGINSGNQQIHTIKAGINYHFNWGGPIVAKY
ncbi:outer membrane protein [Bradyrhizobium sp. 2TAF24]|uniref:outer membrane protein n=1 Tax=Bradyrhizobium sp. 2TAF24 TaxID=3233011 RepID=UPI003F92BC27